MIKSMTARAQKEITKLDLANHRFFMISSFIGGSSFTESLLDILPAIAIGGTGYAIFRVRSHQKRLVKAKIAKQLEDLKAKIQLADRKVRLLDTYLADHDDFQYNVLAQQLLPQLSDIKAKAITLKDQLDPQIYRRITKKPMTLKVILPFNSKHCRLPQLLTLSL